MGFVQYLFSRVLRFAPSLTSSEEEIDFGLSVLDESMTRAVETADN